MKVLVCGSRHFKDKALLEETLRGIEIKEIIHGGARGADTLAGEYAQANSIHCSRYMAEWGKYGERAGPIRNHRMLTEGRPGLVVAFLFPDSRGTKHMIDIAFEAGIETKVIACE